MKYDFTIFFTFYADGNIRRKYLDTKTNSYKPEFQKWYNETGMDDVIRFKFVAKTNDPSNLFDLAHDNSQ